MALKSTKWRCLLCSQLNNLRDKACDNCGRCCSFVPKSIGDDSRAKPLLLHALESGNGLRDEQIDEMLKNAPDVDATDSRGFTALHCAARMGQRGVVRRLLRSGAQIEKASMGAWRALHHAVAGNQLNCVAELLDAGAEVDATIQDDDLTPLLLAASLGLRDICELLIQCHANATLLTKTLQRSALHLAVAGNHLMCVQLLLERKTMELLDIRDRQGTSALELARLMRCNPELVQILTVYVDNLHRDQQMFSSFFADKEIMDYLMSNDKPKA